MSKWDGFDPNNMTDDQRDELLGDVYGGYKQTNPKPVYGMAGAGDGRAMRPTGQYTTSTNYDAYENHPAWNKIASNLGISGAIDNQQELGVMANYVAHYGKDAPSPEMPEITPETPAAPEESPEIEYSPEIQNAKAFVKRYEQGGNSPYNDLSSQDFMQAYKRGFDARYADEAETPTDGDLNSSSLNTVNPQELNQFGDSTFNPINKKSTTENFFADKKNLVLEKFKA